MFGRKTPYTAIGVRRLPCTRCGEKACHQWNVCADGFYRPICIACDVELNQMVLRWMGFPDDEVRVKMERYLEVVDA
jgi:hypothetical protein